MSASNVPAPTNTEWAVYAARIAAAVEAIPMDDEERDEFDGLMTEELTAIWQVMATALGKRTLCTVPPLVASALEHLHASSRGEFFNYREISARDSRLGTSVPRRYIGSAEWKIPAVELGDKQWWRKFGEKPDVEMEEASAESRKAGKKTSGKRKRTPTSEDDADGEEVEQDELVDDEEEDVAARTTRRNRGRSAALSGKGSKAAPADMDDENENKRGGRRQPPQKKPRKAYKSQAIISESEEDDEDDEEMEVHSGKGRKGKSRRTSSEKEEEEEAEAEADDEDLRDSVVKCTRCFRVKGPCKINLVKGGRCAACKDKSVKASCSLMPYKTNSKDPVKKKEGTEMMKSFQVWAGALIAKGQTPPRTVLWDVDKAQWVKNPEDRPGKEARLARAAAQKSERRDAAKGAKAATPKGSTTKASAAKAATTKVAAPAPSVTPPRTLRRSGRATATTPAPAESSTAAKKRSVAFEEPREKSTPATRKTAAPEEQTAGPSRTRKERVARKGSRAVSPQGEDSGGESGNDVEMTYNVDESTETVRPNGSLQKLKRRADEASSKLATFSSTLSRPPSPTRHSPSPAPPQHATLMAPPSATGAPSGLAMLRGDGTWIDFGQVMSMVAAAGQSSPSFLAAENVRLTKRVDELERRLEHVSLEQDATTERLVNLANGQQDLHESAIALSGHQKVLAEELIETTKTARQAAEMLDVATLQASLASHRAKVQTVLNGYGGGLRAAAEQLTEHQAAFIEVKAAVRRLELAQGIATADHVNVEPVVDDNAQAAETADAAPAHSAGDAATTNNADTVPGAGPSSVTGKSSSPTAADASTGRPTTVATSSAGGGAAPGEGASSSDNVVMGGGASVTGATATTAEDVRRVDSDEGLTGAGDSPSVV